MPTTVTIDSRFLAVFSLLILFGLGYDQVVGFMERRRINGYTWAQVTFGVAVGVSAAGFLVDPAAVRVVLVCLACCGTPMIIGAVVRHEKKVRASLENWRRLFYSAIGGKPDDPPAGGASE